MRIMWSGRAIKNFTFICYAANKSRMRSRHFLKVARTGHAILRTINNTARGTALRRSGLRQLSST